MPVLRSDNRYKVDNDEVVYRLINITYAQTSSLGNLPRLNFSFIPTEQSYINNQSVIEVGSGAINFNGGSTFLFNTSSQGDETKQYNITHQRVIVPSSSVSLTYTNNTDDSRHYSWNSESGKNISFLFSHPTFPINSSTTIYDEVPYSELTLWIIKSNYTDNITDQDSNLVTSTLTDNSTSEIVIQEWDLVSGDTSYIYNLEWNSVASYLSNITTNPITPNYNDNIYFEGKVYDYTNATTISGT